MTLWTFGDSFSKHYKRHPDSWVERTGRILEQDIKSYSHPVAPLEYSFYNFNEQRDNIRPNDIIIFVITDIERRWFWKDDPLIVKGLGLSDIDKLSIKYYRDYLYHVDQIHDVLVNNFLYNLEQFTKKLNLHTIVFSAFDNTHHIAKSLSSNSPIVFASGNLNEVSCLEYKKYYTRIDLVNDIRLNHISKCNHIMLSDKVVDNIKNKTNINLNTGFKQSFLEDDIMKDPAFVKDQLFNGILYRLERMKVNRSK